MQARNESVSPVEDYTQTTEKRQAAGKSILKIIAIALTGGISLAGIPSFFLAASADEPTIIEQECHRQLNLGPRGCSCIRERAEDILNKKQQRMVVALVRRDLAASDEMQSQMTAEEMAGAANFMMSAPRDCAEN